MVRATEESIDIDVQERWKSLFLEKKKLKEKLQKFNKRYRLITENVNDFITIVGKNLSYEYINEEFHRHYLGYLKEDLIGSKAYSLVHPDDIKRVLEYYKISVRKGEGKIELRVKHKNGHYIWVEVKGKRFTDINGELKTLLISRDITERKEAEKDLKKSYEEIRFYKDLFMHDIANIHSTMNMSMELLDIYKDDLVKHEKEIIETIKILKDQTIRGSNLISNVKKISDLEEEKIKLKEIDINAILKEAIEFVKYTNHIKKVKIITDTLIDNIFVLANDLLIDVFENILINSIKFTNDNIVEIVVRPLLEGNYLRIEFIDKGIGIEDELKKKVFEKGFKTKKQGAGMGLGLYLVKKLVDYYNGKIWVEDRVKGDYSKGSKFVILLKAIK